MPSSKDTELRQLKPKPRRNLGSSQHAKPVKVQSDVNNLKAR